MAAWTVCSRRRRWAMTIQPTVMAARDQNHGPVLTGDVQQHHAEQQVAVEQDLSGGLGVPVVTGSMGSPAAS